MKKSKSILEAMACGLNIVTTNYEGVSEIIKIIQMGLLKL